MKRLILAVGLALVVLISAGAQSNNTGPQPNMGQMRQMMRMMGMMQNCPMNIEGASVGVEDTANGVAITLTPKDPSQLDALRKRVREFSERMQMMKGGMHAAQ